MRATRHLFSAVVIVAFFSAAPLSAGTLTFQQVAAQVGIDLIHTPAGDGMPSFMQSGGAVGDFNNDGWQDVFMLMGGGAPDCLFINNGNGTFSEQAQEWGCDATHWGSGVAVGDYDADGWLDVYVTSFGPTGTEPGQHKLYHNLGGTGFENVAVAAGVNRTSVSEADGFGAAFGDYDLDGDLDLAVAGWVLQSGGNKLFRNNGDGTFTDATSALHFNMNQVRGFSPRFADMNNDRYPELLWMADFRSAKYFINNKDGTFTEATAAAGVGHESNGMGNTTGDVNNDGLLDWYSTSIYDPGFGQGQLGNQLYINQGNHEFLESGLAAGVDNGIWGWGTVAVDLDHDGWIDLVETNGWNGLSWSNKPKRVYMNNHDLTFTDRAANVGVTARGQGRGLVNVDFDNDGDEDLMFFLFGAAPELYRNDISGPDANWMHIRFDTSGRNDLAPNGFGVRVKLIVGEQTYMRYIDGGCNYLSQSELAAHFGIGAATIVNVVRVEWPNGRVTTLNNLLANQQFVIEATLAGDLDHDRDVDIADLAYVLSTYSRCEGDNGYNPAADQDGDGCVTISDLSAVLADFGVQGR